MTLLIATTNPDKIREIRAVLAAADLRLQTLADYGPIDEPDEAGATFEENARIKATGYARALKSRLDGDTLVVAEDSGLVIDALDGEPGVRSARFLRAEATYPERFAEIDRRLAGRPDACRSARFVCALAVANRDARVVFETQARVEGVIADRPAGLGGFGYDPIFFYPPYGRTLAQVSDEEKRAAAHRGQAFRALAAWIAGGRAGSPVRPACRPGC